MCRNDEKLKPNVALRADVRRDRVGVRDILRPDSESFNTRVIELVSSVYADAYRTRFALASQNVSSACAFTQVIFTLRAYVTRRVLEGPQLILCMSCVRDRRPTPISE